MPLPSCNLLNFTKTAPLGATAICRVLPRFDTTVAAEKPAGSLSESDIAVAESAGMVAYVVSAEAAGAAVLSLLPAFPPPPPQDIKAARHNPIKRYREFRVRFFD